MTFLNILVYEKQFKEDKQSDYQQTTFRKENNENLFLMNPITTNLSYIIIMCNNYYAIEVMDYD